MAPGPGPPTAARLPLAAGPRPHGAGRAPVPPTRANGKARRSSSGLISSHYSGCAACHNRNTFSAAKRRFSAAWGADSAKGWAARLMLNTAESPRSYMGS